MSYIYPGPFFMFKCVQVRGYCWFRWFSMNCWSLLFRLSFNHMFSNNKTHMTTSAISRSIWQLQYWQIQSFRSLWLPISFSIWLLNYKILSFKFQPIVLLTFNESSTFDNNSHMWWMSEFYIILQVEQWRIITAEVSEENILMWLFYFNYT